jgi:phage shock protein PspC (stress-responsive transcriptional regulator)
MNRTTRITIGGRVFHIEDDGFELLNAYLQSLRVFFAANPDRDEIMGDIEARIAERFAELSAPGAESIPAATVRAVMDSIGSPADLGDDDAPVEEGTLPRKLFRDPRSGVLAGIAAGLAAYLDLDVRVIRALFAIGVLLYGVGAAVYFVLWLVVPAAVTTADELRMRGAPVNLAGIARRFQERVFPPGTGEGIETTFTTSLHHAKRSASVVFDIIERIITTAGGIARKIVGVWFIAAGALLVLFVSVLTTLGLTSLPAAYLDPAYARFLATVPSTTVLLSGATAVIVPAVFLLVAGASIFGRRPAISLAAGYGLAGIWFLSLIALGVTGTRTAMQLHAFAATDPIFRVSELVSAPATLRTLDVERLNASVRVVDGAVPRVTISGRRIDLDRLSVTDDSGVFRVRRRQDVCVLCDSRQVRITVAVPRPDSVVVLGGGVTRDYAAVRERERRAIDSVRTLRRRPAPDTGRLAEAERADRDRAPDALAPVPHRE